MADKTLTTEGDINTSPDREGLFQEIIRVLTNDAELTAIVPATQIFVGPVDIVEETQSGLQLPQINIHMTTELSNSVPSYTRDVTFQLDIWSRNSQLEVERIYEKVLSALTYYNADYENTHIFWVRLSGAIDSYEGDRRIFHRVMNFVTWIHKP